MIKVIKVKKASLLDKEKLEKFIAKCICLNSNILIFGLPNSGKSLLVKSICGKSPEFETLNEEEVLEDKDNEKIKTNAKGKFWVVGHQFPSMNESVENAYLHCFLVENMGLKANEWVIIRITKK